MASTGAEKEKLDQAIIKTAVRLQELTALKMDVEAKQKEPHLYLVK